MRENVERVKLTERNEDDPRNCTVRTKVPPYRDASEDPSTRLRMLPEGPVDRRGISVFRLLLALFSLITSSSALSN